MEVERYYKHLTESLKLLSLSFSEQMGYFPEFVDAPFEILDTFEKAFCLLPQLLESNKVASNAMPNLLRLHNLINWELQQPDFDTLDAQIISSKEWSGMAELSKEILILMNEPIEKPDPNYI